MVLTGRLTRPSESGLVLDVMSNGESWVGCPLAVSARDFPVFTPESQWRSRGIAYLTRETPGVAGGAAGGGGRGGSVYGHRAR